jgi:hypothetical protein
MFNLVIFHSEGGDKDNGLSLSNEANIVIENAKDHFDNIAVYTPTKLKEMGYEYHVKERNDIHGIYRINTGAAQTGAFAWKPLIIFLELQKLNDGDILVYRDCNCTKITDYKNYNNIRNKVEFFLNYVKFDFFVPRDHYGHGDQDFRNKYTTKPNILKELGENHPFSYEYGGPNASFICIRKSKISIELLTEWLKACETEKWIDCEIYEDKLPEYYKWGTGDQCILGVILANWIRKGKLDKKYSPIFFWDRCLDRPEFNIGYSCLQHL